MIKPILTFVRDMNSPQIGTKLWSDITFVNFKARQYINESPINAQEIDILSENGFMAIDSALADTVMRLNSLEGCKTRYCCSGHPGSYSNGYILFEEVPQQLSEQLNRLKYWKQEEIPNACEPHLIYWTLRGISDTDTTMWLRALLELAEMECLPQSNTFDEYRIESTYKGRSPHKQEFRHIYLEPSRYYQSLRAGANS